MKKITSFLTAAVLLAACQKTATIPSTGGQQVDAIWSTTAAFGSFSTNGYDFNNDVWGSGAGPQTLWVNSSSNWGVWSNQPNTGGVKSYPHASKTINKTLSSLKSCTSSFNVTVPAAGSFESAYDIWDSGNADEIMLWENWRGSVGPISSTYNSSGQPVAAATNVNVGGATWNVYRGSNGANAVFSFLKTSTVSSGTVDVRAILLWIESKGWFGNITLGSVQFGFEITSSSGGQNFTTNSYSVSSN
jgi:hypothetical protein